MSNTRTVPVIAIDGPSASGKGTIAQRVAQALGFHYLESGALYRVIALLSLREGIDRMVRDLLPYRSVFMQYQDRFL